MGPLIEPEHVNVIREQQAKAERIRGAVWICLAYIKIRLR
jgi:hypothetical protein